MLRLRELGKNRLVFHSSLPKWSIHKFHERLNIQEMVDLTLDSGLPKFQTWNLSILLAETNGWGSEHRRCSICLLNKGMYTYVFRLWVIQWYSVACYLQGPRFQVWHHIFWKKESFFRHQKLASWSPLVYLCFGDKLGPIFLELNKKSGGISDRYLWLKARKDAVAFGRQFLGPGALQPSQGSSISTMGSSDHIGSSFPKLLNNFPFEQLEDTTLSFARTGDLGEESRVVGA